MSAKADLRYVSKPASDAGFEMYLRSALALMALADTAKRRVGARLLLVRRVAARSARDSMQVSLALSFGLRVGWCRPRAFVCLGERS